MDCNGKRFFADDDKVEIRKLLGTSCNTRSKRPYVVIGVLAGEVVMVLGGVFAGAAVMPRAVGYSSAFSFHLVSICMFWDFEKQIFFRVYSFLSFLHYIR